MKLIPLLLLAGLLSGCGLLHHSQGWKRADLTRNRLDLGLSRDLRTGERLAAWSHEDVVASGGSATTYGGGDLFVVVRYDLGGGGGLFADRRERVECWRFTTPDGHDVEFHRVRCPVVEG